MGLLEILIAAIVALAGSTGLLWRVWRGTKSDLATQEHLSKVTEAELRRELERERQLTAQQQRDIARANDLARQQANIRDSSARQQEEIRNEANQGNRGYFDNDGSQHAERVRRESAGTRPPITDNPTAD